ncbi:unnamed protein product [Chondrus crispus]|uniref:Protein yippee-like n=1 Tax=Chondrus crispus TaxID=2769 RepID=R7Q4M4_CHOCR|nr:unnamed protein product [Chondrus crispus]CDF32959.1 unnamed protein product [Chondrus crispus]|eukprot:XP_005712762.1 unnamed protein product [Chondrus crispus]
MTATQGSASTEVLEGDILHTCASCGTHLASAEDVVSKGFQGKHGRAYLFSNVVNITLGEPAERELMTGTHTIVEVRCVSCKQYHGWKYISASHPNQSYKVDKFLLELKSMKKVDQRKSEA